MEKETGVRCWLLGCGNVPDSGCFLFFEPSSVHLLCYQTFPFFLSEAPLKTLSELFDSILIFNLHLSAEMPGANCFSWTAAHELTYNLIQVQLLKGSAAPLTWVISVLHDVVEIYQTNHNQFS